MKHRVVSLQLGIALMPARSITVGYIASSAARRFGHQSIRPHVNISKVYNSCDFFWKNSLIKHASASH